MIWYMQRKRPKKTVYLSSNNSRLLPMPSYFPEDFENTKFTIIVANTLLNYSIEEKEGDKYERPH